MDRARRIAVPVLIIALGIVAMQWLRNQRQQPPRQAAKAEPPTVRTVTLTLAAQVSSLQLEAFGTVVPQKVTTLAALVDGRILFKSPTATAGRFVDEKTLLIRIDPQPMELRLAIKKDQSKQVKLLEQELKLTEKQTRAQLVVVDRQVKIATEELDRTRLLAKRNATAQADVNRAEQILLNRRQIQLQLKNTLEMLPQRRQQNALRLSIADADEKLAALEVAYTKIHAPHSGLVTTSVVEAGDSVKQGDTLLKIEDTAAYEIQFPLKSSELVWVWQSDSRPRATGRRQFSLPPLPVHIHYLTGEKASRWSGHLDRLIGDGIDPKSQLATCRATIGKADTETPSGPPTLWKGMFVRVTIDVPRLPPMLVIPIAAWRPQQQVWIVRDGQLIIHSATPIQFRQQDVLIRTDDGGPKPGDKIVVSPLRAAFDGMPVTVQDVP